MSRRLAQVDADVKTKEEEIMSSSSLMQIEKKINQLSREDQLLLIERVVHRLQKNNIKEMHNLDSQLTAMAYDPEIQEEVQEIENEFAYTETDGLGNCNGN